MSTAIDLRSVSRDFDGQLVLDKVSLQVRRGEIHALLGPNGAGKTTLLRVLCGLVEPASGDVVLDGADVKSDPSGCRRRIGFVPSSDRSFYLRLSARENLLFFARLQGLRWREAQRKVAEVIDAVGLADVERRRVHAFSHGMQKRLAVARALLTDPPVLLVDEATHDLDPAGAMQVQDLVRAAAHDGAAVLWATQRLDEIRGFADEVTVLNCGQVRFQGTLPQLMAQARSRRYILELTPGRVRAVREVISHFAGRADLRRLEDRSQWILELDGGAVLGHIVAALQAAGVDVRACREQESGMNLAFLRLTSTT